MAKQNSEVTAQPASRSPAGQSTGASLFHWLRWILCGLVGLYVAWRAITLALTCDEWGLILEDVQRSFAHLLVQGHVDVQSTFLLVCLAKVVALFTGNPILAVRLPSVLAIGLYLWAAWRITASLRPFWLSFLALLALCANAYMLDFFSIGRGYSLALAFQMLSLDCFSRSLHSTQQHEKCFAWCLGAVWSAAFSVLAIVAFLNFFLAVWACCFFLIYWIGRPDNRLFSFATFRTGMKNSLHLIYCAVLLGIFYLPRVLILNMNHCFSAGGADGFIQSTVQSLIRVHFYLRQPPDQWLFIFALFGWIASVLATLFLANRYKKTAEEPATALGIYVSLMLIIMAVFHVLLFHITKTLYPVERAALSFFPLFILQFVALSAVPRMLPRIVGLVVLGCSIGIGLNGLNGQRTQVYNCSAQHPAVIEDLARIHQETGQPMVLGVTDRLKYTLGWYAEHQLGLMPRPNPDNIHDGLMRRFDWLTIYTLHYGKYRLFSDQTTHILLDLEEMSTNDVPAGLTPIQDYPVANIRLYDAALPPGHPDAARPFLYITGEM